MKAPEAITFSGMSPTVSKNGRKLRPTAAMIVAVTMASRSSAAVLSCSVERRVRRTPPSTRTDANVLDIEPPRIQLTRKPPRFSP